MSGSYPNEDKRKQILRDCERALEYSDPHVGDAIENVTHHVHNLLARIDEMEQERMRLLMQSREMASELARYQAYNVSCGRAI